MRTCKLLLIALTVLLASCVARSQEPETIGSTIKTFKYEMAISVHYDSANVMHLDEVIACDSSQALVILGHGELKVVIQNKVATYGVVGNLKDQPDVYKLVGPDGSHLLLRIMRMEDHEAWFIQGSSILVRLSNQKACE